MKKLCKQSLAVLTMLALLLTFAPGTLRAANHAEADASYFTVDRSEDNNSSLVTVKKNEVVKASFDICDAAGNATTAPLEKVYIWATDANGVISSALNVKDAKKGDIANTWYFDKVTVRRWKFPFRVTAPMSSVQAATEPPAVPPRWAICLCWPPAI